ncbi:transcriptional regulator [Mesorhizobium sp. SP-1A]|uniref:transcriptional regulator n=1 Tax=Mesorhizobium sp. SP-1A TaxID=3077840 RepID=UPI0028F6E320|nr:transcriptional regulator [Mesorhizobium sp. SP-1A]
MPIFSEADFDRLARPHVARAWFLELDLPAGISRLHSGTGRVMLGGHEWRGVTDPIGGQMVSMDNVEEPRFGQAVAVNITLSGANKEFFKSVHATARQIEGRRGDLYWAAFDGETGEVLIGLKRLFPGKITSPSLHWQGIGVRTVSITLESIWSSQNYAVGGKWTPADQRRRFPGDAGLDFVGVKVTENWSK